jgi:hypothetical protein
MRGRIAWALCLPLVACGDPSSNADTATDIANEESGSESPSESETGPDETSDTSETGEEHIIPEFGDTFTVIGSSADGLNGVRDLEFDPFAPTRLWTFNTQFHGVVIFFDPGTPAQTSELRADAYGQHFMAYVSSAAFGAQGVFASCQESRDEWNVVAQPPDDFMGPTLWSSDLAIFAMVGQDYPPGAQEGSHLDMLHQSPLCMGIAHDVDRVFWAFDGLNGNIVRYDFQNDHGPGGGDHSDGIITRYMDASVTRVPNVPGHMEIDHSTGMLYVADTGGNRVMRLDTASGTNTGPLPGEWDGADYTGVQGADFQVLVADIERPSGLALHEGVLFVGENATSEIVAFDLDGNEIDRLSTPAQNLMGITIGPDGHIYYVDPIANEVVRVDP